MWDFPPIGELCHERDRHHQPDAWAPGTRSSRSLRRLTTADKEITLYGSDRLLNDIGSGATFTPGETLKITRWQGGVEGTISLPWTNVNRTAGLYRDIKAWKKPATAGYVTLYALDEDNNYMWTLAKAHPDDTLPRWRRVQGPWAGHRDRNVEHLAALQAAGD